MLKTIDLHDLTCVTGGACPKYQASADELARRSHMTKAQRAAADRAWQRTVSHLSPERLAAVQREATTGECKVPERLLKLQLNDMRL